MLASKIKIIEGEVFPRTWLWKKKQTVPDKVEQL